jgi:hypothetical protein
VRRRSFSIRCRSAADAHQHAVRIHGTCAAFTPPDDPPVRAAGDTANRCRRVECTVNSRARSSSTYNVTARRLYDRPQILVMPFYAIELP